MAKLPRALQKGPFTYKQALKAGLNLRKVRQLLVDEQCYTVAKGIYMPTNIEYNEENQFKVATLIVGPRSAISLLSALSSYGLTDVIPRKTWITVPAIKRTQILSLKLLRQSNPQWTIGIERREGYCITTIERTLVESLCYKNMIGASIPIEATREAIRKKLTSGSKVLEMAKKMGVVHRILPYLEAFT